MEKENLKDIQAQLQSVSTQRKNKELEFEELQTKLEQIQTQLKTDLETLHQLKDEESALQKKVYHLQKDAIKDSLSLNGFKSLFTGNNSLIQKIKEKGQEIKEVFDNTHLESGWIDEQYTKYKELCIKKGEEIKSKEEFQRIAQTLKNLETQNEGFNFSDLFSKATKGVSKAGGALKDVLSNINFDKILGSEEIILPRTKQEALEQWIQERSIQKSTIVEQNSELYEDYTSYLNWVFNKEVPPEIVYSQKGGAFTTALKKHFDGKRKYKV